MYSICLHRKYQIANSSKNQAQRENWKRLKTMKVTLVSLIFIQETHFLSLMKNLSILIDHESIRIEDRFMDVSCQIGELTSLARALTEKISSSNRDESGQNFHDDKTSSCSDNTVLLEMSVQSWTFTHYQTEVCNWKL